MTNWYPSRTDRIEMSSKPSRSEIESALASRQRSPRREQKNAPSPDKVLLESGRRRQQVIGGDLGGVASRRHRKRLAWLRNVNLINWIAAVIVLLILLAFFWPDQDKGAIREIAEKNNSVESESFYSESRIDQPPAQASRTQTFNRATDIERADQFRSQDALDQRIREMLKLAREQIAKGQYTQPEGDNASNTYKQVLLLDSNNYPAGQGLEYIRSRFLDTGLEALAKNNQRAARLALERLSKVDEESDEYLELQASLEQWRLNSRIQALLDRAEDARQQEKLILPARDNTLYYLQQVLELDDSNQDAMNGIQQIADSYIEKANQAISVGAFQSATGYLATVSVIDPDHPSLPLMEEMLSRAEPLAAQAGSNIRTSPVNGPAPGNAQTTPTASQESTPTTPGNSTQASTANETEILDRQLLSQGLEAYYKGNYDTAAALLQPLADKGISRAQFRIGYMYFQGRGFAANRTEADRIIRAALPAVQNFADEGRAWAQSDIGSLYEDGLVLPRDYGEAVYWYRSAAEQGYPGAQTNLGIMYARGRGVGSSRRTAIEWFQRAAKQGDELAKRNLEAMGVSP